MHVNLNVRGVCEMCVKCLYSVCEVYMFGNCAARVTSYLDQDFS